MQLCKRGGPIRGGSVITFGERSCLIIEGLIMEFRGRGTLLRGLMVAFCIRLPFPSIPNLLLSPPLLEITGTATGLVLVWSY